ncbi:MAG: YdeI/OmpD-associated family protein [Planctomycetes bacterium]|nr:YdeI/OmpD-associated family protein [Planctomycetota bacterium]
MVTRDKRIDAYIQKSAGFARPILEKLRAAVHSACPEVEETVKWGHPCFQYKGMLCNMAAFKQHCSFGFWKHALVVGKDNEGDEAWGSFGRLTTPKDLPPAAEMKRLVKKAMKLNDEGVKVVRNKTATKKPVAMHPAFQKALAANKKARATFENFSPSHQREYMEWISDAKAEETRERRLKQALEWLAEGKSRNWKYEKC